MRKPADVKGERDERAEVDADDGYKLIPDLWLRGGFVVQGLVAKVEFDPRAGLRNTRSQPAPDKLAPRLGEHSAEVLREIGFDEARIADMMASGVSAVAENRR